MKTAHLDKYDKLLVGMQHVLQGRKAGVDRGVLQGADEVEAASISDALDVMNITSENTDRMLTLIHDARERIANDRDSAREQLYGICQRSIIMGEPHVILHPRLEAIPHAKNCVDCQLRIESRK